MTIRRQGTQGSPPRFARAVLLSLVGAACVCGCSPAAERALQLDGRAFGTTWNVRIVLAASAAAPREAELRDRIAAVLERIDHGMSTWRSDAEIARFNRDSRSAAMPLSPETRRVVSAALELARETGGAFDPTVAPLVGLWGFGAEAAERDPDKAEIEQTLTRVGWRKLYWDEQGRLARRVPGVELDLSAIAKGYAVDAVVAELGALRPRGLLVEIGGEVRATGTKPGGAPWRVGVEHPDGPGLEEIVELGEAALATSGDYRQQRRVEGRLISHVIDPRTGRPAGRGVASASVIAPTCAEADAVATALMVLTPEQGRVLIEARPWLEALWLVHDAGGALRRQASSGWSRWTGAPP